MSHDQISAKYNGMIVALSLLCLSSLCARYPKSFSRKQYVLCYLSIDGLLYYTITVE